MVSISSRSALADRLRLSVGRLARQLRQHSMGGLTPSQRSVLATLGRHGPMTMSRLAEIEHISRPSATGIASRLAERGLIERQPHPDDGRSALVGITSQGTNDLKRGRREGTAFLSGRLDTLTAEERDVLAQAVEVMDRLLEGQ